MSVMLWSLTVSLPTFKCSTPMARSENKTISSPQEMPSLEKDNTPKMHFCNYYLKKMAAYYTPPFKGMMEVSHKPKLEILLVLK